MDMKKTIENFISATGWTSDGTLSAYALNAHPAFIAGGLANSLIVKVPAGNTGKYLTKTISVDVTDYDDCIFWVWSRHKSRNQYNRKDDFFYKVDFGGTGYYVSVNQWFCPNIIYIGNLTTLSRVRITALHNDEDYLILSYMQAIKEEIPLDIFQSMKDGLRDYFDAQTQISVGTVSAATNDVSITVTGNNDFLERYTTIKISDGNNSEIHQIENTDGAGVYTFNNKYAGEKIINNFTNATVSLYFPVEFGVDSTELYLPGVTIQGMTPESILRGSTLDFIYDTFATDNTVQGRREDRIFKHDIIIDCDARHLEIVNLLSKYVRNFASQQKLWLNGQDAEIVFEGIPTYTEPLDPNVIIHKIQYIMSVEYKESIFTRTSLPIMTDMRITTNIL